eukprot:3078454-Heterocapsa_arctica.AAC.1
MPPPALKAERPPRRPAPKAVSVSGSWYRGPGRSCRWAPSGHGRSIRGDVLAGTRSYFLDLLGLLLETRLRGRSRDPSSSRLIHTMISVE